jgi:iron complex outermembrane receptor protein
MRNHLTQAASLAVLVALGAGVDAASAQAAPDVAEVVVTGSRIRTSPLDQAQPVVQIDEALVAKQGLTSTVDVLQRIPSAAGGLNSKFNNSGNLGNPPDGGGVGAGSAEIDLRYLSSRRVLVLVDGLRWVPGAAASGVPGSVDLNTIPSAMISRMEVLQEGASPIYGSDAIAGVVNIITKDRQEGFTASAQIGQTDHSDGFNQEYNVSWGVASGSTHIVVGGGYFKQDPVFAGDRKISRFPAPFATACDGGCSSGTPLGRFIVSDPNTGQDLNLTLK